MKRHGSSSGYSSISRGGRPGGPSLSSPGPVDPKRSFTAIASAPTPPHPTLQLEEEAPGSSATTTNLYALLKRDIEPQGQRSSVIMTCSGSQNAVKT